MHADIMICLCGILYFNISTWLANVDHFPSFYSTCFNRIDLPLYEERSELVEKLQIAITMASAGFDIE